MISDAQGEQVAAERRAKRGKSDPLLKLQKSAPLDSDIDGVAVAFDGQRNYSVRFAFNPVLVNEIRKIPGAEFSEVESAWQVPLAQYEPLRAALTNMRSEFAQTEQSKAGIKVLATRAAVARQEANGQPGVQPRLSYWQQPNESTRGEIVSLNDRFAAQLTGFGAQDGAAFITLHRLSSLSEQVFKGDVVAIKYDGKGHGAVAHPKSAEQKLDDSLGRSVDGVKVTRDGETYKIEFEYLPALSERIARIDGAAFNRDEKVWSVDSGLKEFVARAVNDMRKEVIADRADRAQLETIASEKIDSPIVKDAYVADGKSYTGTVLAMNDRYVLQHTGQQYAALHRRQNLSEQPHESHNVRIAYKAGRGAVSDKSTDRAEGISR
jgi:hypothetical protein